MKNTLKLKNFSILILLVFLICFLSCKQDSIAAYSNIVQDQNNTLQTKDTYEFEVKYDFICKADLNEPNSGNGNPLPPPPIPDSDNYKLKIEKKDSKLTVSKFVKDVKTNDDEEPESYPVPIFEIEKSDINDFEKAVISKDTSYSTEWKDDDNKNRGIKHRTFVTISPSCISFEYITTYPDTNKISRDEKDAEQSDNKVKVTNKYIVNLDTLKEKILK